MSSVQNTNGIIPDSDYEDRYSVYTFRCSNDNKAPLSDFEKLYGQCGQYHCTWNKYKSYDDKRSAMCMAKELYESGEYDYVEIKKRFVDRRTKQAGDQTIAVIGDKKGARSRTTLTSFALAITSGAAAILCCALFLKYLVS